MSGAVGVIEFQGPIARNIDRMMGRLPALDKAIQDRYPRAQNEIGSIMARFARLYVQSDSGEARGGIGFRVSNGRLYFGIKGVAHATALEFGYKGRELVSAHDRMQTTVIGRALETPLKVRVGQHVRQQNKPARPFLFRAYFDSFRAMYGILNRIIGEAQKEVGFDG